MALAAFAAAALFRYAVREQLGRGGPGIPPAILDKVFTPFFTTKARGSGLGLPTVKRFVEAHDGEIAIDCPPAGGTTVEIRLPMTGA